MGFVIAWVVLCGLCAWYASSRKGRSGIGFFFLSLFSFASYWFHSSSHSSAKNTTRGESNRFYEKMPHVC